MLLTVKAPPESYSCRTCRCGQAMRPTGSPERRWECRACGRTAR